MDLSFLSVFQFLVIGVSVGFLGGFLGVGGGIIMIPLLLYWAFPALNIPPEVIVHLSFGTSLAIIIPTSLSGTTAHARNGNVTWPVVLLLALPGILGSFLGSTVAASIKGPHLRVMFGALLILLSVQMLFQKKGLVDESSYIPPRPLPTVMVGLLVGVFSGFFGLGGGVIAIPLMVRFLGIPIHRAVGISIAFVFFASLVGTGGYILNGLHNPHIPPLALGYVHLPGWVLAGVPSIFLAQWGVKWSKRTNPVQLRRIFALLLLIVGIRMLF